MKNSLLIVFLLLFSGLCFSQKTKTIKYYPFEFDAPLEFKSYTIKPYFKDTVRQEHLFVSSWPHSFPVEKFTKGMELLDSVNFVNEQGYKGKYLIFDRKDNDLHIPAESDCYDKHGEVFYNKSPKLLYLCEIEFPEFFCVAAISSCKDSIFNQSTIKMLKSFRRADFPSSLVLNYTNFDTSQLYYLGIRTYIENAMVFTNKEQNLNEKERFLLFLSHEEYFKNDYDFQATKYHSKDEILDLKRLKKGKYHARIATVKNPDKPEEIEKRLLVFKEKYHYLLRASFYRNDFESEKIIDNVFDTFQIVKDFK